MSAPPLNYRLAGGVAGTVMPSWEVADDVDVDSHVRHSALPRPGGELELGVLVSRLHSNPMDLSRPLWEYHLIEGLAGHRFAIYIKLHHAMVDGAGAMRLANLADLILLASFGAPFWADAFVELGGASVTLAERARVAAGHGPGRGQVAAQPAARTRDHGAGGARGGC